VSLHAREAARHRGVAWSGFAPEPYEGRPLDVLRAEALAMEQRRQSWREGRAGRLLSAVAAAQKAAQAAHAAAEAIRAALSRSEGGEPDCCGEAADQVEAHAMTLLKAAQAARRLASEGLS